MLRYIHANVASFFFVFLYLHTARWMYYSSYKTPRVLLWSIGVVILVLTIGTAFLGYWDSPIWLNIIDLKDTLNGNEFFTLLFPLTVFSKLQKILSKHNLTPVTVWENLDHLEVKTAVRQAVRPFSGVYIIINLLTEDMYVGSGIVGQIGNRFHRHLFSGLGSQRIWSAVQKYGLSNFAFLIIEKIENIEITSLEKTTKLLSRENHYLTMLLPVYNIAPQAGYTFGVKHTDETKAKMRLNYSSERRKIIGSLHRGKRLSASHIEAIRATAITRGPMSYETRAKVSANSAKAQIYLVKKLDQLSFASPEGVMVRSLTLRTIPVIASFLGCAEKTVRRALKINGVIKQTWQIINLGKANK